MELNKIVEKTQKEKDIRDNKRGAGRQRKSVTGTGTTTGRVSYEYQAVGGDMFLVDAINKVFQIFANDRANGERMLALIQPARILEMDYVKFLICHKMA
jgi:hypothetical protein